MGIMNNKSVR